MSRIVVITGAGSGLGRAIAKRLGKDGDTIVLLGRTLSKLEAVAKAIGDNTMSIECELTSADSVRAAFAEIAKVHPKIDVLINNAGIYASFPVVEASDEQIDSIIATNVNAPIYCARSAIPMLRRGGLIINVSSESYESVIPLMILYRSSKAALEEFSSALAAEIAPLGIRVTTVRAGSMRGDDPYPDVDPAMVMRTIEAWKAVGIDLMTKPMTHFDTAAETFHTVINLPPTVHMPFVHFEAAKPETGD